MCFDLMFVLFPQPNGCGLIEGVDTNIAWDAYEIISAA